MHNNTSSFSSKLKKGIVLDIEKHLDGFQFVNNHECAKLVGCTLLSIIVDYNAPMCFFNMEPHVKSLTSHVGSNGVELYSYSMGTNSKNYQERLPKKVKYIKENAWIPLEGPLSVEMVMEAYDLFTMYAYTSVGVWYSAPLIAIHAGEMALAKKAIAERKRALWFAKRLQHRDKVERYQKALERVAYYYDHPDELHQLVEEEIVKHKLTNVPRYEFVPDSQIERYRPGLWDKVNAFFGRRTFYLQGAKLKEEG